MKVREMQKEVAVYLSRYSKAKAEVHDIEHRIERVRNEMMGIKGIDYTGGDMPKQQNRTGDLSDYIAEIDDLIREWQTAQTRAIIVMREISSVINGVKDAKARRVLMLHFVDDFSYEEIAEKMDKSINSVYRWRRIGLTEIGNKNQNGSVW